MFTPHYPASIPLMLMAATTFAFSACDAGEGVAEGGDDATPRAEAPKDATRSPEPSIFDVASRGAADALVEMAAGDAGNETTPAIDDVKPPPIDVPTNLQTATFALG